MGGGGDAPGAGGRVNCARYSESQGWIGYNEVYLYSTMSIHVIMSEVHVAQV